MLSSITNWFVNHFDLLFQIAQINLLSNYCHQSHYFPEPRKKLRLAIVPSIWEKPREAEISILLALSPPSSLDTINQNCCSSWCINTHKEYNISTIQSKSTFQFCWVRKLVVQKYQTRTAVPTYAHKIASPKCNQILTDKHADTKL